ncbi:2-amino-4-hydroxy-6-hydroxymethyldihydropteridine diphosphokinase [Paenibacillus tarimensis]
MDKSFPYGADQANSESLRGEANAFIALGSNLGDRQIMLEKALEHLDQQPDISVIAVSALYETDPVGFTEQPAFLNMAAGLVTTLSPSMLLRKMLETERLLGRVRDRRWGPRTIDLDLLYYAGCRMDTEELTLPHPRMMERAFVLVPLSDVLARTGSTIPIRSEVEAAAADVQRQGKEGITLWNTICWRSDSGHSGN